MSATAAAAISYEGGSCKFDTILSFQKQSSHPFIFLSILVKAFLAKAKDEFQAKYDKPGQVSRFRLI